MNLNIINPATEEVYASVLTDTPESVKHKVAKLREGQRKWKKVPIEERLAIISLFGELVHAQIDELAFILTSEMGKPITQAVNEIKGSHNRISHLEQNAVKWLSQEVINSQGSTLEKITFEPLGVIANISAWNYPYNVGYNVFLYALVAGNAVCYKPSEYATITGIQMKKLLYEAGVPNDVFDCFIGDGRVGEWLLDSELDGYFFTGSYNTGKHIASRIAHTLVPVQLELGGKDPLYIVDDISDVEWAAKSAAEGAFYNTGQSCCAVERIYVHENIYDQFIQAFVQEVHNYKTGDPLEKDTFIGPLARKEQIQWLSQQVENALDKGGRVLTGGKPVSGKGYYFQPTVITDVSHRMSVMREETFGPVIGIQKVKNDREAILLMQDTEYGLTAGVYTADEKRAIKILEEMDTGTVYWNCCDRVSADVPWTGRKNSGRGSTLSYMGIRAFVQPKAYHLRKI